MVMTRRDFHAGLAAALAMAAVCLPVAAKEYRSADVHPEDYPTVMAVKFMSDYIKQKTNGKDSIKVYTGNQLGGEKDTIEQTKLGGLDLVRINVAPMNNIVPETMVPTMPFLFRSKEHMRKVLDGPIGDEILKAAEAQGFVGLAFYDSGARSLYTVKKPVKSLADAKGMKIRVQQSDLWVSLLQAMGANATPMPYGEVYTALQQGIIDGQENPLSIIWASRLYEVQKYLSLTGHVYSPVVIMISDAFYNSLPEDLQKIVVEAFEEVRPVARKMVEDQETELVEQLREKGMEVNTVEPEAFQAKMGGVYDDFVKNVGKEAKEFIDRIKEVR